MKLGKAIEILGYHSVRNADVAGSDWANALKLGIEALKSIKQDRVLRLEGRLQPLPGETEE